MSRQLPLIQVPFRTRLFSTDFLEHEFREWPEWKEGQGVFDPLGINIGHLLDGARRHGDNEDQLRADFIVPVLDELGWKDCYNTQAPVTIEKARNAKKADYALYDSPAAKQRALERKADEKAYWRDALAVMEAKAWDRPLDTRPGPGKDFSNQFPRFQIHQYMRYSERRWGILTNGKIWRLIHADSSHDYDIHYEADLESLLEDLDIPENLYYFSLFFRREAFTPEETGTCFLDRVLRQSRDARLTLEDNLKEVVGDALHALMDGFARHAPNGIKEGDDLAPVKEAALILLYRLLFIFNAEDRLILPVENDQYRNGLGFVSLAAGLREKLERNVRLPHDDFTLWQGLSGLFNRINAGYRDNGHLTLTAYNGGLFNPGAPMGRNLARWRIDDRSLAAAIDRLYWRKVNGSRRTVRYRDMDIRHLGNIYEGLLEQHPRWVDGAVIVGTAKGERKTSGSYYTPDFIVRHIVENTLGPLCDRLEQEDEGRPPKGRRKSPASARHGGERFSDRVLALRVLDPAMGSGHFLIEAADYLARRLAEHDRPLMMMARRPRRRSTPTGSAKWPSIASMAWT